MKCSNCGFELVDTDVFCPKCGTKVIIERKHSRLLIGSVMVVIAISIMAIVIHAIFLHRSDLNPHDATSSKDENTDPIVLSSDDIVGEEKSKATGDDGDVNEADNKSKKAANNNSFNKISYFKCEGNYPMEFDNKIIGMKRNEFFEYTGINESNYEYFKLTEGDETYVSERSDYPYDYNGLKITASNRIYYREDKVVSFTFSMNFNESTVDAEYMDRLFNTYVDVIKKKGEGVYCGDDLNNIISLEEYEGELCWKDETCYTMLNASGGIISHTNIAIDYMDKHDDIYSAGLSQAYKQLEDDIRSIHGGNGLGIENSSLYRPEYDTELPEYVLGSVCIYDNVAAVGYKDYFEWEDGYVSDIIMVYYFNPDGEIYRCLDYRSAPNITFANEKCCELAENYIYDSQRNYYGFEDWQATYYYTDRFIVAEMSQKQMEYEGMTEYGAIAEIVNNLVRGGWSTIRK